jgi:Do/DeqQ family serine protease
MRIRSPIARLLIALIAFAPAPAALAQHGSQGALVRNGVPSLAPLVARVTPGVVNIATSGKVKVEKSPLYQDPYFRRFLPEQRRVTSIGSGVIVDARRGYVLTNHHVVRFADQIVVRLKDRRVVRAKLIGSDTGTDIAVLKIPARGLTAVPFGDSDALEVGDYVVAIGNPFGLGQTVTQGIVSAIGRTGLSPRGYENYIQTDAPINPGNSGGPLIDLHGRLVGINAAILGRRGNIGISFAIPANMARRVMTQILRFGNVQRGELGVVVQDLTPETARKFKAPAGDGAVVREVSRRSAAAAAGIRVGDVITAINGHRVRDAGDLRSRVGTLRVGARVRLTVYRKGRQRLITAVIRTRPRQTDN